jgi:tRNA-Thr(GGU) m(6)t(6)A37 methyltransferase TsaA
MLARFGVHLQLLAKPASRCATAFFSAAPIPSPPTVEVIGTLRSCFKEKYCTPRQPGLVPGATASLTISKIYQPELSLAGLEGFSHVWLISSFHLNTNKRVKPKVHPPRLEGAKVGLFATRSPHRPSPIGLSLARLVEIKGGTIHLAGIDLVDGTPILDIKPYIPEWDIEPSAVSGPWMDKSFPSLSVEFSVQAEASIQAAEDRLNVVELRKVLTDILNQDVRNSRDKAQSRDGVELGFFLHDFEVRFSVSSGIVTVVSILTDTVMVRNERRQPMLNKARSLSDNDEVA